MCETVAIFGWVDYTVVGAMLVISTAIGLFYGCSGASQSSAKDFLRGGGRMATLPAALSLATGFVTAVELLGNPAEMYMHGSQFWLICVTFLLVAPLTSRLYLPVFRALDVTSAYEYLELRFSLHARTAAAAMYVLQMALYTSVAVYAPAVALSNVTGLNTYIAVSCVYVVCIAYASQGGMKAVMMTDTFQAAVLVASILTVLILGHFAEGGFENIWRASKDTQRIELFKMTPSPTVQHTFWSVLVGGCFYWATMFCSNQASVQKYLSVATTGQARKALWVSSACLIFIFTANFYTGMIVLAKFQDCDPVLTKEVSGADELLPLYVMTALGHFPGVPGLFVAGIFCASLGTVAAALNSLAAVAVKDFLQGACGLTLADKTGARVGKWVSLAFGLLSFGLVFVVERLDSVMQAALSFNGMVGGVTLGMFSVGMFFPWANNKGVLVGTAAAMAVVLWIGVGAQVANASGALNEEPKWTTTDGCHCGTPNVTALPEDTPSESQQTYIFQVYRISYLWYSLIGCTVTVVVALATSLLTGLQDPQELDPLLLSPPVAKLLHLTPQRKNTSTNGLSNPGLVLEDETDPPLEKTKF